MDTGVKAVETAETSETALRLVQLMLLPYDELIEVDFGRNRVRSLRHAEGKYFSPLPESSADDMLRYATEYMVHPEDRDAYAAFNDPRTLFERLRSSETPGLLRARFRYKLLDGGWRAVEQINVGGTGQGLPDDVCYVFLFDRERQPDAAAEQPHTSARQRGRAERQAERNGLTGLLWEETFSARAAELVQAHPEGWCLIAIDLENFKIFNEWYGREQGDLLLAEFGAQLTRVESEVGGLACYYGQDDFALLMPNDSEKIQELYERLHDLVSRHGTSVGFLPALGVTPVEPGVPIEDSYDRASLAARRAKASYHERICAYDPAMFKQTERDYQILSDFQTGLADHELFIVLQPQCAISTGRVVGAESLVRWRKEDGEMISPGVFVPVLEEYGFVTDLDKFVWEEVCRWQRKWIDGGHTPLPVSVNVSQIDIFTIDVPAFFEQLLKKYDLPVGTVKVEITESAYVDNDSVSDTVRRLREKGFLVLMDDFGSGYSSLNMLRSLNVDVIKLDAQFLRMNSEDRKGVQIVESIVNMAKTMGVPIIAEGVETQEETNFLSGLGCRYVQGYFFYRPMPVREFERLISDPLKIDTRGFRFRAKDQFHTREFLDQSRFSDAMLNNILGPVAFFAWHGDEVDILRYNQQFFEETKTQDLAGHTKSIQRLLMPEDVPALYRLMEDALRQPLSGAVGVLRFARDGAISQYRLHFFYMEEDENSRKFYCSVQNLTKYITLNDHMRLLSMVSTDTIVFMREKKGRWVFQVVVHGLEKALGLSREELEREFNDGSFFQRADDAVRDKLRQLAAQSAVGSDLKQDISFSVRLTAANGKILSLRQRLICVHDKASRVEYILLFRKEDI